MLSPYALKLRQEDNRDRRNLVKQEIINTSHGNFMLPSGVSSEIEDGNNFLAVDGISFKFFPEFFKAVIECYMAAWQEENQIPDTHSVFDNLSCSYVDEFIKKTAFDENCSDIRFQEDDEYRDEVYEDYREMYWSSVEAMTLEDDVRIILDTMRFTYKEGYDESIQNPAQQVL